MSFSYQGLVPNPKDDLTNLIQPPVSHILPLSALWRMQHSSLTLIGGIAFSLGSYQYLPWKDGQGGSLFVLGSVALFCADLMNWWSNRVGCACDARYREDLEEKLGMDLDPAGSPQGQFQRAEAGLNYFLTLSGSLLYVVGCVLFDTREVAVGDVIFIPGSVVLMLSEGWKVKRLGSTCNGRRTLFDLANLSHKRLRVGADGCIWLGAACFLAGSVLFLPMYVLLNY
jgi:hypothetical protein